MTFLMNGYEMIVGFTVLMLSCASMIVIFERKYKLILIILALLGMTALSVVWRRVMTGSPFDWHAIPTFFHLAVFICMMKGPVFQKIFVYFMQYILLISQWYFVEAVVGFLINPESIRFSQVSSLILMVMFAVYTTLIVRHGKKLVQKMLNYGRREEWAAYAFGAMFSFILLTVTYDFPGSIGQYITTIFFVVWNLALLCYAIITTHEKAKKTLEAEYAAGIISTGRDHYQKLEALDTQLRIMRHDMKYHLAVVHELLASDKRDAIDEYLSRVEKTLAEHDIPKYSANNIVNALLVSYAERCEKLKIRYDVEILLPDSLSIPNYELCIVIGNLLENAVEACQKLAGEGWIELLLKPVGQQLAIRVRNNYAGGLTAGGELPGSTKKDGGFGLISVQAVAAKYDGEVSANWDEDDIFTVYVTVRL